MNNKRSYRADSLLGMRDRICLPSFADSSINKPVWACCNNGWASLRFFESKAAAEKECEKLLEENITAVPKRVNISITFPITSQGDIS